MVFSRFEQFWLTEYQRQLDQADLPAQLRAFDLRDLNAKQTSNQQLQRRALRIAEQRGTTRQLVSWQRSRRLLTLLAGIIAIVLGAMATQTVLAQPQPLSLLFALVLLLVPNLVMFLFWLLVALRSSEPHGVTAVGLYLINWFNRKRQPHSNSQSERQQLSKAWLQHVQQQRLLAPLMALASHGFWLFISASSWLTLLLYLSFNDYQFHWATTILAQPQLVMIADVLNTVPGLLFGTEVPLPASNVANTEFANLAGRWLATCVLVYGVAPRAIALLISLSWYGMRLHKMKLDSSAPGHVAVLQTIRQYQRQPQVIDADQGDSVDQVEFNYASSGQGYSSASLDYEANTNWSAEPGKDYFGVLDSQAQKSAFIEQLRQQPRQRVELRVAANLTPDRSSLRFLAQVAHYTVQLSVQLILTEGDTYLAQWQRLLKQYGVSYVTL